MALRFIEGVKLLFLALNSLDLGSAEMMIV